MKSKEELESNKMTVKLCDWMDAHDGREPSITSKNREEKKLAEFLAERRLAKRLHDLEQQLLKKRKSKSTERYMIYGTDEGRFERLMSLVATSPKEAYSIALDSLSETNRKKQLLAIPFTKLSDREKNFD